MPSFNGGYSFNNFVSSSSGISKGKSLLVLLLFSLDDIFDSFFLLKLLLFEFAFFFNNFFLLNLLCINLWIFIIVEKIVCHSI
jgi:hypothetical protein